MLTNTTSTKCQLIAATHRTFSAADKVEPFDLRVQLHQLRLGQVYLLHLNTRSHGDRNLVTLVMYSSTSTIALLFGSIYSSTSTITLLFGSIYLSTRTFTLLFGSIYLSMSMTALRFGSIYSSTSTFTLLLDLYT